MIWTVFKPLVVRWMHFPLSWMVPCTCSIFLCVPSHLFPCLLAFWPLSDAAFPQPSLCFLSATPALAAWPTWGGTWLSWLPAAAWQPFPGLANRSAVLLPSPPFLQEDFAGLCIPWGDEHELAPLQPLHCSRQTDRCSPGPPAVQPSFCCCILSWVYLVIYCLLLHIDGLTCMINLLRDLQGTLCFLFSDWRNQPNKPQECYSLWELSFAPFFLYWPFPSFPRRGTKQHWLTWGSTFCPTEWQYFVKSPSVEKH